MTCVEFINNSQFEINKQIIVNYDETNNIPKIEQHFCYCCFVFPKSLYNCENTIIKEL